MGHNKLNIGERNIGTTAYTIDDITSDAVLIVKPKRVLESPRTGYAILRAQSESNPVIVRDAVNELLDDYLDWLKLPHDFGKSLDATLIGGMFNQNRQDSLRPEVYYVEYRMTSRDINVVLSSRDVEVRSPDKDFWATKTISVDSQGKLIGYDEQRNGLNKIEDAIPKIAYDLRIRRGL